MSIPPDAISQSPELMKHGSKSRCGSCLECPSEPASRVFINEGVVGHNPCSVRVKLESHLFDPQLSHRLTNPSLVSFLTIEQQESTAACTGDLSTQRSILPRQGVSFVDHWIRDLLRDLFLRFPTGMKQGTKSPEITFAECRSHLLRKIADFVHGVQSRSFA